MGALTSKPYAFTARPWELRSREAVDYFDSFGSSIRVDLRGLDIMRILPRINEALNEEWITDKVRFSYDGLKRQRLISPLRKKQGRFLKVGWIESFTLLLSKLLLKSGSVNLFVGKLVDLNGLHSMIALFKRLNQGDHSTLNLFYAEDPYNRLPRRYRTSYLFPSLEKLESTDLLLLVGSNIRLESPLLNIRVRRRVISYHLPVFSIGFQADLTYESFNLGLTTGTLRTLIEGRHPFIRFLIHRANPLILFSHVALRLSLVKAVYLIKHLIDQIGSNGTGLLGFMSLTGSSSGLFDYGILNEFDKYSSNSAKLNWVLNNDEICFDSQAYTVYSGHHGDRNALLANLILPFSAPFERASAYLNMNGVYQETDFMLTPPVAVRSELHFAHSFLFFIRGVMGGSDKLVPLPSTRVMEEIKPYLAQLFGYYSKTEIRPFSRFTLTPFLFNNSSYKESFQNVDRLRNTLIMRSSESYYLDNQITRASHVMALAQTRFKRYNNINFKQ